MTLESMKNDMRFAGILARYRIAAGKSQDWMHRAMGVSLRTVQSWERGDTFPSFRVVLDWFRVLGINPQRAIDEYLYPEMATLAGSDPDSEIEAAFAQLMAESSTWEKRALLFLRSTRNGSSWKSTLNATLAWAQCPLEDRVKLMRMVCTCYELAAARGDLSCPDNIQPVVRVLNDSIEKATQAALAGKTGYGA